MGAAAENQATLRSSGSTGAPNVAATGLPQVVPPQMQQLYMQMMANKGAAPINRTHAAIQPARGSPTAGIIFAEDKNAKSPGNLTIQQIHRRLPCKFFKEGRCQKGSDCEFSHNSEAGMQVSAGHKKMHYCNHFASGKCFRGTSCPFTHFEPDSQNEKLLEKQFQASVSQADFVDFETGLPRSALPKEAAPVPKAGVTVTIDGAVIKP